MKLKEIIPSLIIIFFVGCKSSVTYKEYTPLPQSQNAVPMTSAAQRPPQPGGGGFNSSRKSPKSATLVPGRGYAVTGGVTDGVPMGDKQSGLFYSKDEELWVISRPAWAARVNDDHYPGTGALMAKRDSKQIPMPLKHTDVKARVLGYIASVEVQQKFENPYDSKIEAVYVFPLPENSAVDEFVMTIGFRQIRGIIRERAEAETIYERARAQGYVASLLTQERPNIFTQSVANIEPGREIDVNITYYNTLSYMDGWFEFVFPMVVGPRFNPAGSTNGVPVSYLKTGERSGNDIMLHVDLNAGVPIEEFASPTHKIHTERMAADRIVTTLARSDRLPNKDFVLRYRVTSGEIKSGLLTHKDERGGFFSMMIYPPASMTDQPRHPMEMIFVLDCSGSMNGRPIDQAKKAIREGLKLLKPEDSFQLINFSMSADKLDRRPLPATPQNIRRGLDYLDKLDAEGGTMMFDGIKAALDFYHDPHRLRYVCFLTDGYIGNETDIIEAIQDKLGPARIFSFGVGSSVNRYLLDSMAKVGRGAVAYLLPGTDSGPIMAEFFARASHPALTDLEINWGGMKVKQVYPKVTPDLYAGRPVLLTGRFQGNLPGSVTVSARNGSGEVQIVTPVLRRDESAAPALASIWARAKIADLSFNRKNSEREIRKIALDYSLLSQFTAFVAVDSTRRTSGSEGTTVNQAVPVPQGVKYSTTVGKD